MKITSFFARVVLVCAIVKLCSGCASIVSNSEYSVAINSNLPGTPVFIEKNGLPFANVVAPTIVSLPADNGYMSRAKYVFKYGDPNKPTNMVALQAKIDPWYWGNIVFGGLIGMLVVDPITGAMWKFPLTTISDNIHTY